MHKLLLEMQAKLAVELPVNNSTLGTIKRYLCDIPPFGGGEFYLQFGGEFHSQVLENKSKYSLGDEHQITIDNMHESLQLHPVFRRAMKGKPKLEALMHNKVHGVPMRGTLDILNGNCVYDLKTTSETSERGFIRKALKIGYLRQAHVYKTIAEVDNFIFIGVSKKSPYQIFILNVKDYEKQEKIAIKETKFLLEIVKTICINGSKQNNKPSSK